MSHTWRRSLFDVSSHIGASRDCWLDWHIDRSFPQKTVLCHVRRCRFRVRDCEKVVVSDKIHRPALLDVHVDVEYDREGSLEIISGDTVAENFSARVILSQRRCLKKELVSISSEGPCYEPVDVWVHIWLERGSTPKRLSRCMIDVSVDNGKFAVESEDGQHSVGGLILLHQSLLKRSLQRLFMSANQIAIECNGALELDVPEVSFLASCIDIATCELTPLDEYLYYYSQSLDSVDLTHEEHIMVNEQVQIRRLASNSLVAEKSIRWFSSLPIPF